jgi:hypothetical protein
MADSDTSSSRPHIATWALLSDPEGRLVGLVEAPSS